MTSVGEQEGAELIWCRFLLMIPWRNIILLKWIWVWPLKIGFLPSPAKKQIPLDFYKTKVTSSSNLSIYKKACFLKTCHDFVGSVHTKVSQSLINKICRVTTWNNLLQTRQSTTEVTLAFEVNALVASIVAYLKPDVLSMLMTPLLAWLHFWSTSNTE